jgi:chaperonin cofactor prefoldin
MQKMAATVAKSNTVSATGPTASLPLDEATRKELDDLQEQFTRSAREHRTVQAQLVSAQQQAKLTQLTRNELEDVADDAKCYKSVGKMFLRAWSDKAQVLDHLDQQATDFGKQESELIQKMDYLGRRIKSQRQNIDELLGNASTAAKVGA